MPLFNRIILSTTSTILLAGSVYASAADTERVSVDSNGVEGNERSWIPPAISGDGRFVVFHSRATNLVPDDINGVADVFLHDRLNGTTVRASVTSTGSEANSESVSTPEAINADGRYIVFSSRADNLDDGDSNDTWDVFVHDRLTGGVERASVDSNGNGGNGPSTEGSISADGRYVVFLSQASNLAVDDSNGIEDLFVHDRISGTTDRIVLNLDGLEPPDSMFYPALNANGDYIVFQAHDAVGDPQAYVHDRLRAVTGLLNVDENGNPGNDVSGFPSISNDGRYVAFASRSSNLVENDTNGFFDVFVRDLLNGTTEIVSVSSEGQQGNYFSRSPNISGDGQSVAFLSAAYNLTPGVPDIEGNIYVHERLSGTTELISVGMDGSESNDLSIYPVTDISGRYVAFYSEASNLVPGDTNNVGDIFVRDRGPLSSATTIGAIEEKVLSLVPASLKKGQANGLLAKLRAAISSTEAGRIRPACQQLSAFQSQSSGLITSKQLAEDKGQELIDDVTAVRADIGCFD